MCGHQSSRHALHERRRKVSGLFWFAMLLGVTFGSSKLSYRDGRGHSRNLYAFVPSAGIRGLQPLGTPSTQRPHSLGQLYMIGSLFNWKSSDEDGEEVPVLIESPNSSTRRISSSIIVNRPIEDVWRILTDYDRLADYVPNLTQSKVIAKPPGTKTKGVRLFQEGAQRIIGFDFRASLTMDMEEIYEGEDEKLGMRRIKFKLIDSPMFRDFSGEWRIQFYSRLKPQAGQNADYSYSSKLFYMVNVMPKGPVPVAALEWRIREDVPTNLRAVKAAAERLPWNTNPSKASSSSFPDWEADETLEAYISNITAKDAVLQRA